MTEKSQTPQNKAEEEPKMRLEDKVCFVWLAAFGALILGAVVKAVS